MEIFSKIINEKTKELDCIVCGSKPLEGYCRLDAELGYDGKWYLSGYAPKLSEEQKQKEERERLDSLCLTSADVERAIYKAKRMDFDDILELVKNNPEIDLKALKIELKANNFYRGNPYINQIGTLLGFIPQMLDEFFKTNDYTKLLPIEDEISGGEASDIS